MNFLPQPGSVLHCGIIKIVCHTYTSSVAFSHCVMCVMSPISWWYQHIFITRTSYAILSPEQNVQSNSKTACHTCDSGSFDWQLSAFSTCSTNFTDRFQRRGVCGGWGCCGCGSKCRTLAFVCALIWPDAAVCLLTLGHLPLVSQLLSCHVPPQLGSCEQQIPCHRLERDNMPMS